ncbi:hypothetical protein CYMTET_7971, partial [Cymbomonas tetramitiformis]
PRRRQFSPVLFAEMDEDFGPFSGRSTRAWRHRRRTPSADGAGEVFRPVRKFRSGAMLFTALALRRWTGTGALGVGAHAVGRADHVRADGAVGGGVVADGSPFLGGISTAARVQDVGSAGEAGDTHHVAGPGEHGGVRGSRDDHAILVGFYGLFSKDNLTVGKSQAWNARVALVREDVLFAVTGDVVWIRVRHSKIIQYGERYPTRWSEGRGKRGALVPMTHAVLVAGLKKLAEQVGLDPPRYAGQSLRRGGATAALRLKVDKLYIKLQGQAVKRSGA